MSSGRSWEQWVGDELWRVQQSGQWRFLRALRGKGPRFTGEAGGEVLSFASNDYLGLSAHPEVISATAEAASRWGCGAGSSRLIVGDRQIHHELEDLLREWKATESALVFPSGYQANLAVLTTFGSARDCRIVSDELNHASIIDGARLARAEVQVYRHGDVDHARSLVRSAPGPVVVVSDSVFSMDGDTAPVTQLSKMCAAEHAMLVLDDAHAVFEMPDVDPGALCLRVGTLSKALGSQGGFVCGAGELLELLINKGRSFIFTTGLAPTAAAAALSALRIVRSSEGHGLVSRLRSHVDSIAPGHPSPIVPVILGSEAEALRAAELLLADGLLVPAIRPPTVPPGTSRLRVSLSAAHERADVERLRAALSTLSGLRSHDSS